MNAVLPERIETLLTTLLTAQSMEGVKAWAIAVAFRFALESRPNVNPTDIWKAIQQIYQRRLLEFFPGQQEPAQSFRRTSGDAFEAFVHDYLNDNLALQREGIRAVRLTGQDFASLMSGLDLHLRPKDIDMFLQGFDRSGRPRIFGAVFPKASYAERIRADEGASRALMGRGLWSSTVTMDARDELGTPERPSVKRDTINDGGFHACFSFNQKTVPGDRIFVVNFHEKAPRRNPLIAQAIAAFRQHV